MALAVLGINGLLGDVNTTLLYAAAGLLVFAVSVVVLLAAHGGPLSAPNPYCAVPFILAAALHGYQTYLGFPIGWFAWWMTPYLLALAIACFRATRFSAVVGAFAALVADVWIIDNAFKAPFGMMDLIPFWNMLIVGPAATWVVWFLYERRASRGTR